MEVQHDNKSVFKASLLSSRNVTLEEKKNWTLEKQEFIEKFQLYIYIYIQ